MSILTLDSVLLLWFPALKSPQDDIKSTCSVTALQKYCMNQKGFCRGCAMN